MEKLLMDEKYSKTIYRDDLKLAKIVWNVSCTSEEYRTTYLKLLDFQRKFLVDYFISDIRNQRVISPDDRKWFENEIISKAIQQGLKKAAVISSDSAFKKYYMNLILATTKKFGLPLKVFSSEEDAIKWLCGKS